MMKDFNEALLTLEVRPKQLAGAYKKALEDENSRRVVENITTKNGVTTKENKIIWNGNHCHVEIGEQGNLTIALISHTLPNLQEIVKWYEKTGATVVYKSWE